MGCGETHRKWVSPWGSQEVCFSCVYVGLPLSIWGCLAGSRISMGIRGLVRLGCVLSIMEIFHLERDKRNFHGAARFSEDPSPPLA